MTTTTSEPAGKKRLSPRKRAQRWRFVQYGILIVVVVLVIFLADWKQLQSVFLRTDLVVATVTGGLGRALLNTIIYSIVAFIFGMVVGTILALMKLSSVGPYRWIASIYIEFFRGLPAIIVFLAFSLLPLAFAGLVIPLDPYGTVWLALGIVASAYIAETVRAGIQAVPKGQIEAARSLGMTQGMATFRIVLPQAFRIIIPPLTNELIIVVKDSSLVYVIGLSLSAYELTKYGRDLAASNVNLTPLMVAGASYLIITLPLSMLVRYLEKRGKRSR